MMRQQTISTKISIPVCKRNALPFAQSESKYSSYQMRRENKTAVLVHGSGAGVSVQVKCFTHLHILTATKHMYVSCVCVII